MESYGPCGLCRERLRQDRPYPERKTTHDTCISSCVIARQQLRLCDRRRRIGGLRGRASPGGRHRRHCAPPRGRRIGRRGRQPLDAFVPEDGKSVLDSLPHTGKVMRELARAQGGGSQVPPIPASVFAVNATDAAWVDRQCTMQPLSSLAAAAHLSGRCNTVATIGYMLASGWEDSLFRQFSEFAGQRRWRREDLA